MKYRCANCNFTWVPKTSKLPTNCPYCGKNNDFSADEEASFSDVNDLLK